MRILGMRNSIVSVNHLGVLECGNRTYLCSNEKPVADATIQGPFTNEGFRRTILAVVITLVGFHPTY
jgi:hypothetical protein